MAKEEKMITQKDIKFYSQRGEDKWLYDNWLITEPGVYVDIGSADPFINSNTAFLDQLGWGGLCVEPNQYDYSKRHCIIKNVAVNTYDGTCSFHFNGEIGKIDYNSDFRKIEMNMPCLTLKTLIEQNLIKDIGLMSIDIEGMEYDIFTQYYNTWYLPKPKILITEYNTLGNIDDRLKYWLLAYTDYKLIHVTDFNYIFTL